MIDTVRYCLFNSEPTTGIGSFCSNQVKTIKGNKTVHQTAQSWEQIHVLSGCLFNNLRLLTNTFLHIHTLLSPPYFLSMPEQIDESCTTLLNTLQVLKQTGLSLATTVQIHFLVPCERWRHFPLCCMVSSVGVSFPPACCSVLSASSGSSLSACESVLLAGEDDREEELLFSSGTSHSCS